MSPIGFRWIRFHVSEIPLPDPSLCDDLFETRPWGTDRLLRPYRSKYRIHITATPPFGPQKREHPGDLYDAPL
ncbi:hypothetical protein BM1_04702 [Bipolaris maydis]|nr:hypothetical protein BM1_04702 [Bipolaris maydis]